MKNYTSPNAGYTITIDNKIVRKVDAIGKYEWPLSFIPTEAECDRIIMHLVMMHPATPMRAEIEYNARPVNP